MSAKNHSFHFVFLLLATGLLCLASCLNSPHHIVVERIPPSEAQKMGVSHRN
jgi:hypothetical protein